MRCTRLNCPSETCNGGETKACEKTHKAARG